jgi:hypothetical protein
VQILGDLVMESNKELIESFKKKATVEDDDACVEKEQDAAAIQAAGK